VARTLSWADAHRVRTSRWPSGTGGQVHGAPGETWLAVSSALRQGLRGLPRSSLARLLARRLGARNRGDLPRLTERDVLRWADVHRAARGRWPNTNGGRVGAARGETWKALDAALKRGGRGLPGGSSLTRLLAERRQAPDTARPPRLTEARVLSWADAHRRRTGQWPGAQSGRVEGVPGETWYKVDLALWQGNRSLPGGDSLRRLLRRSGRHVPERRGRPRKAAVTDLAPAQGTPACREPRRPRDVPA
jgi:hypothetical protein